MCCGLEEGKHTFWRKVCLWSWQPYGRIVLPLLQENTRLPLPTPKAQVNPDVLSKRPAAIQSTKQPK